MMGFGSSDGHGGFAASSNLSPLAPPFTVDRPTSRSALNINAPPYGTPYTSSLTNWGRSQAPDYEPGSVSEAVLSSYFPNSTIYASSPAEPQIDHLAFPSSLPDSISFSQFPSSLINNDFGDGNYYAPPSTWDKSSVMAQNELGYKSSSTLNRVRITQDNYTQSLYGLQYPSQWDQSWDRCLDLESGGKTTFLGKITPEVPNFTSAATCRNYFKEGSELPKLLGKASDESCVPRGNNAIDIQSQVGSLGTDAVVNKPFSEFNTTEPFLASISAIPLRTSGISFQTTSDGSSMDSWCRLITPTATNGTILKEHCLNDISSARTSFGGLTIGHPSAGTMSSFRGSLPPQDTVKHSGNDLSGSSDDIGYDQLYNVRDPWIGLRSKPGQEIKKYPNFKTGSIDPQIYDSNDLLFPTKYGEPSGITSVIGSTVDVSKYNEVTDVHGNIHNLEGFSLLIDDSDQYNPSEDSPCWKGSSSHFSQFQVSEAVPSQHHMKSLNSYDGLNNNEPPTFSLSCKNPTTVISTDFHEKTTQSTNKCLGEADALLCVTESGYIGNHLYGEPKSDLNHMTNILRATEQSSGNEFSFLNEPHISVEANAAERESFRSKKHESDNPIRLYLETVCCGSDRETASACMLDTDVNLNDAPVVCQSYVPSNAAKQVLSSLSSDADVSSKHNPENWAEYAPELKPMLLKTIVNLSDLLLIYYLNDEAPVRNEDHKALEFVLSKLTRCLKFAQEKSLTTESSIHKQGPSSISNEVLVHQNLARANKSQVTNTKSHDGGTMLGSKLEGLHKPVKADSREEAGSMIKAVKEILDANFHEDAESHPLASMYKNLWLEAEAALCSTNYKARFHRMKIEKEKSRSYEEKEKLLECKSSPTHMEVFRESPSASRTVHTADVMERYNILKCRVEPSNKGVGSELDTSKISLDQGTADKLSTQVNGFTSSETFIKDANIGSQPDGGLTSNISGQQSPNSLTNTYGADIAEDHVMSRLQILKNRDEYPKYMESVQQTSEFTLELVGKRDCTPVCGGELLDRRFKPAFETEITKATVAPSEDRFIASGSQPNCGMFTHKSETVELGFQFSGGWYENSSSDWEHVLKDEFAWNSGAIDP